MIAVITAVKPNAWPSAESPDVHGLRDAAEIMAAMRRRIDADSATGDDQRRYRVAAGTLERLGRALGTEANWPSITLDAVQLHALLGETGTGWPPEQAGPVIESWRAKLDTLGRSHPLTRFLAEAKRVKAGIVISVEPVATADVVELPELPEETLGGAAAPRASSQVELADALEALHEGTGVPFADERGGAAQARHTQARALRAQIVDALRRGDVVPVGMAAPHDVITEVLREMQDPTLPAGQLRIIHVDSSEGAPFPLGAAAVRDTGSDLKAGARRSIRLGLMSVRHMSADATVAGYWFRNRLVSVSDRTLAETEAFCYRDTLARLDELVASAVGHIELLHTGFEPAAIGFYRAVLEYNRDRRNGAQILVTPRYLHGREVTGTPWVAPAGSTAHLLAQTSEAAR